MPTFDVMQLINDDGQDIALRLSDGDRLKTLLRSRSHVEMRKVKLRDGNCLVVDKGLERGKRIILLGIAWRRGQTADQAHAKAQRREEGWKRASAARFREHVSKSFATLRLCLR